MDTALVDRHTERLRALADGHSEIQCARLWFEGLGAVERQCGRRWPAVRVSIFERARASIETLTDGYIVVDAAEGFLVAFPRQDKSVIAYAAYALSQILDRHFGAEGLPLRTDLSLFQTPAPEARAEHAQDDGGPKRSETWLPDPIKWKFQPYWSRRRQSVTTFCIQPYSHGDRVPAPGYRFDAVVRLPEYTGLDQVSLRVCEGTLRERRSRFWSGCVGASVHLSSLTEPYALSKVLKAMARFDHKHDRQRFIRIAGVPPGFPRLRLAEIIAALRPYTSNVVVATSCEESCIKSLFEIGAAGVGFTLSRKEMGHRGRPEADILARVARATVIANEVGKPFFVDGGIGSDTAIKIAGLGVDYVSTPSIWPPSTRPCNLAQSASDKALHPMLAAKL